MRVNRWVPPPIEGYDEPDEQGLVAALDEGAAAEASPDDVVDSLELPTVEQPPPPPPAGGPPPMPTAAPPVDDEVGRERADIERGAERDRMTRILRGIELGSKQLTAGVLQQPKVAELVTPESTNYEGIAQARADKGEAKRYQRSQGEIAQAHKRAMAERQAKLDEERRAKQLTDAKHRTEREAKNDLERDESQEIARESARVRELEAKVGMGYRASADERAAADEAARRDKEAREAGERGRKDAARSFPFSGGTFVIREGITDSEASQARAAAGLYNAAFKAIDGLDPTIAKLASAKSANEFVNARAELAGKVQATATAANAALGQGAMADNEKRAMIDAMGADVFSLDGARAFVTQDPSTLQRRLRAFREQIKASADGRLTPYGDFRAKGYEEDAKAMEWARAHPDDPRAQAILAHGEK